MLFSCKITNSILSYLEEQGEDTSSLFEVVSLSEEFLRDPSYWIDAEELENFLAAVEKLSLKKLEPELIQKIGHITPELRSWGVLDSVLRMMPRPQEIFSQPGRFLSYFISPEPPVERITSSDEGVSFYLPISSEQFPLVVTYLKAGFETLPVYVGQSMATCDWVGHQLSIKWETKQPSMFQEKEMGHQISPDLLRSIVQSLETHQKELQQKNSALQEKNEHLLKVQNELQVNIEHKRSEDLSGSLVANLQPSSNGSSALNLDFIDEGSLNQLRHQMARLNDYMIRAQQLVTILLSQQKSSAASKEALRRVDWDFVIGQFPQTIQQCQQILNQTENRFKNQNLNSTPQENPHV